MTQMSSTEWKEDISREYFLAEGTVGMVNELYRPYVGHKETDYSLSKFDEVNIKRLKLTTCATKCARLMAKNSKLEAALKAKDDHDMYRPGGPIYHKIVAERNSSMIEDMKVTMAKLESDLYDEKACRERAIILADRLRSDLNAERESSDNEVRRLKALLGEKNAEIMVLGSKLQLAERESAKGLELASEKLVDLKPPQEITIDEEYIDISIDDL